MSMSIESIKSEAGKVLVPAKALSGVFIDTAEKMIDLQMQSTKAYTDLTFGQLKKIPSIRSLAQAGDFLWGQIEPMSEFNKQVLSDWKSMTTINSEFTSDVKTVFSKKSSEPVASIIAPVEAAEPPKTPRKRTTKKKAAAE